MVVLRCRTTRGSRTQRASSLKFRSSSISLLKSERRKCKAFVCSKSVLMKRCVGLTPCDDAVCDAGASQKSGVAWPHGREFLALVQESQLQFSPMMIKRDNCACRFCDVKVSGWRPWHKPWKMHDLSKHPVRNVTLCFRPPDTARAQSSILCVGCRRTQKRRWKRSMLRRLRLAER
jgi:hypothetical protein